MTMEEESSTVTVSMEEDDELAVLELPPGFRFHPTDEELITHYLSPKVADHTFSPIAIGEVDFNKVEPWDLPWRAKMGEKEWYFFCVKDRKYPTGSRTNRATVAGYWKATGKDKEIYYNSKSTLVVVGMKKTLVFYKGRAPNGEKTNWVMHEYRLVEEGNTTFNHHHTLTNTAQSEWVISRIFKKCSGGKKVHISGLTMDAKHTDIASILPPLMDSSSDELANRAAASSSHDQLISPVSLHFPRASTPNLLFPAQTLPFVENLQYTDSILEQEQSIWRLLLDAQNAKANFSQDSTADVSSINSTDLDILWNF